MTKESKIKTNEQYANVGVYQQPYQDDEIDLRELIKVIWDYKWLTVFMCVFAIAGSVFYALNAQEWWVAKGKVIQPQLNDVASLYSQTQTVDAILNASVKGVEDTKKTQVISLFEPETLFTTFINTFNSSVSKKAFLEDNKVFIDYLALQEVQLPTQELTAENQLIRATYSKSLNVWMNEISASYDKKSGEVTLSFRTPGRYSSAELLNAYILFVSNQVRDNQLEQFKMFIDSSVQQLEVSIDINKKRVQQQLSVLLKKTQYAYKIASVAELVDYQTNLNPEEELFQLNLGQKALKAKIDVLKSITDLSLLDPSISQKQIILDSLRNLTLTDEHSFAPFRYLQVVEPPLGRAAPKRALIVILATLLAGMLSIFIALVHYFMTKKVD
jgi:LPS O-antigen subunit length determinant protein (WzzB/FepE family)